MIVFIRCAGSHALSCMQQRIRKQQKNSCNLQLVNWTASVSIKAVLLCCFVSAKVLIQTNLIGYCRLYNIDILVRHVYVNITFLHCTIYL